MRSAEQIAVLKETFVEWLQMHGLDTDVTVYSRSEWEKHEGEGRLLAAAELVFVFENDLVRILHYSDDVRVSHRVEAELQELAEGFGYYFEFGNTWSLGFYPIEDVFSLPHPQSSYATLLQDERWKKKRRRILDRCKNACEECGSSNSLEVHHCYYRYGRLPWQYPDGALLALCRRCHTSRQAMELRFRMFLPLLRINELRLTQDVWEHAIYWFERNDFAHFMESVKECPYGVQTQIPDEVPGLNDDDYERRRKDAAVSVVLQKLVEMMETAGHPEHTGRTNPFDERLGI